MSFSLLATYCFCTTPPHSLSLILDTVHIFIHGLVVRSSGIYPPALVCVFARYFFVYANTFHPLVGLRVLPALPRVAGFPAFDRQESHRSEVCSAGTHFLIMLRRTIALIHILYSTCSSSNCSTARIRGRGTF